MESRTHELKIEPRYFTLVSKRIKTFEVRQNDRDFHVGDFVILKEYSHKDGGYTGRSVSFQIGFVLQGAYGLALDTCCFSLLDIGNDLI